MNPSKRRKSICMPTSHSRKQLWASSSHIIAASAPASNRATACSPFSRLCERLCRMELGAMFARSSQNSAPNPNAPVPSGIAQWAAYLAVCRLRHTASCARRRTCAPSMPSVAFVTVVPKTRSEVETFTDAVLAGDVRWEEILRKRADRDEKAFDVIECAVGPYHLREGFVLHWYRSSQKKKRDEHDRNERIERAIGRLDALDLRRMRGPKTDPAIR